MGIRSVLLFSTGLFLNICVFLLCFPIAFVVSPLIIVAYRLQEMSGIKPVNIFSYNPL